MIVRLPRNFMFPLATLAFAGVSLHYANIVFTTSTRWAFLLLLMLYLFAVGRFMIGFQSRFGAVLLAYCGWCIMTSIWSEVPALSIPKSIALFGVVVVFVSAGHWWVRERGALHALDYLAPLTAVVLIAGLAGGADAVDFEKSGAGTLELYQGLAGNPNAFGSLIVSIMPFLLWYAYRNRRHPRKKWIWFGLVAIAAGFLVRSHARASIAAATLLGMGFCLPLKLPRMTFAVILIMGSLLIALATATPFVDQIYQEYVLKGATHDYILQYSQGSNSGGIFYSREGPWQQSWEAAKEGALFGVGYGVSAGDTSFEGGLTAQKYGREKSSTQLAIVEETGLVGLVLYLMLLTALFRPLAFAYLREKTPDMKVALGIVTGALTGFTLEGLLEAWWVAPGSAESVYFWGLAGVALGLARSSTYAAETSGARPIAPEAILQDRRLVPSRRTEG